eukprot:7520079-Alexandrium_andersonii.AAC.1
MSGRPADDDDDSGGAGEDEKGRPHTAPPSEAPTRTQNSPASRNYLRVRNLRTIEQLRAIACSGNFPASGVA